MMTDIVWEGYAHAINRCLGTVSRVQDVEVGVASKNVTVRYDPAQVSDAALRERLNRVGFPPR